MRYMMLVKGDTSYEAGKPPSPELMAAIGKLSQEMMESGVLLDTGGLERSVKGARVRLAGGKLTVVDGPFSEAKEVIGGFAVMQAKSKEEAIKLASRFLQVHADVMGPSYSLEVEVREMMEMPDFDAGGR